jgi:hypothetical protein
MIVVLTGPFLFLQLSFIQRDPSLLRVNADVRRRAATGSGATVISANFP